jgi:hypothetical protein
MAGHTSWREIRAKRPPNPSAGKHERLKIKLALLHEQQALAQTDLPTGRASALRSTERLARFP